MTTRVAFLLGAGSSIAAGFPTLTNLTALVESSLTGTSKELFRRLQMRSSSASAAPNVERILATLESMRLARVCPEGFSLRDVGRLEYEARKHIWEILQQTPTIDYLRPFRELVSEFRPLDVFSLNN